MSSFTTPLKITAVPRPRTGLARLLPPGWHRPKWAVSEPFEYAVGSLDNPDAIIRVPAGFEFDGASIPFLLRVFVPMAHPNYIQAAALHDYTLQAGNGSQRPTCDKIFYEALGVLGMPLFWRLAMYWGVRIGAYRNRLFDWVWGMFGGEPYEH